MKKILLGSLLLLIGSSAYATIACTHGAAPTVVSGVVGNFVINDFMPSCSANTDMVYTDAANTQKLYGGAASNKGASYFGGSTLGGTIAPVGKCTNSTCGGGESATAAGLGMAAALNYGT